MRRARTTVEARGGRPIAYPTPPTFFRDTDDDEPPIAAIAEGAEDATVGGDESSLIPKLTHDVVRANASILQRHGLTPGKALGSGANGTAYELADGRVIKVTFDATEATSSNHIAGKNLLGVVRIFAVWRAKFSPHGKAFFVVQERLQPVDKRLKKRFDAMIKSLKDVGVVFRGSSWDDIVSKALRGPDEMLDVVNELEQLGFDQIIDSLDAAGVRFHDWHSGNIMTRGDGGIIVIDLGVSRSPGFQPPVLERRLAEERADTVCVVIGAFAPMHRGQSMLVRDLATRYDKVVLLIEDEGLIEHSLRVEVIKASLPDVEAKIEVHQLKGDTIVTALDRLADEDTSSSIEPDTAVEVLVDRDQVDDFKRIVQSAASDEERDGRHDSSLIVVKTLPDPPAERDRINAIDVIRAAAEDDEGALRRLLDPHLLGDDATFDRVVAKLHGAAKARGLKESLDDVGGVDVVRQAVVDQRDAMLDHLSVDARRFEELGHGRNGIAFRDPEAGVVVKATTDETEAVHAARTMGRNLPRVYSVSSVVRLPGNDGIFVVVTEDGLKHVDQTLARALDWMIGLCHEETDDLSPAGLRAALDAVESREGRRATDVRKTLDLDGILDDAEDLDLAAVDLHSGNVMMRGTTPVLIDLGTPRSMRTLDEDLSDVGVDAIEAAIRENAADITADHGFNVAGMQRTGDSGQMGVAFASGDKVLKATTDELEAATSMVLKGRPTRYIGRVLDSFLIDDAELAAPVYGIVMERLTPLSPDEAEEVTSVFSLIQGDSAAGVKVENDPLEALAHGDVDRMIEYTRMRLDAEIRRDLEFPPGTQNPKKQRRFAALMEQKYQEIKTVLERFRIKAMVDELRSLGIEYADFKAANIMKRGGEYVAIDIGKSKSSGKLPPPLKKRSSSSSVGESMDNMSHVGRSGAWSSGKVGNTLAGPTKRQPMGRATHQRWPGGGNDKGPSVAGTDDVASLDDSERRGRVRRRRVEPRAR